MIFSGIDLIIERHCYLFIFLFYYGIKLFITYKINSKFLKCMIFLFILFILPYIFIIITY